MLTDGRRTDLLITGAAAAFALVTVSLFDDRLAAPPLAALALVAVAVLPLLVRRSHPRTVFVVVVVAEAVRFALMDTLGDVTAFVLPVAGLVACTTLAARLLPRELWPYPLLGTAVLVLGILVGTEGRHQTIDVLLAYHGMLAAAFLGGTLRIRAERMAALRSRLETAERTRQEEARRQVVAERIRIARDLHDVLAHHITLVGAQAGVAEYLVGTDPAAARLALRDITTHTRGALEELRATVGLLRSAEDGGAEPPDRHPVPGLHRIGELVEDFRSAGSTVSSTVVGAARELPALADLAAYRIVQEALTNAGKHAPGAAVSLTLTWSAVDLDLLVVNGPAPGAPPPGEGTGHGLLGMRERAHAAGGTLRVERPRAGGFLVAARLPAAAASAGTLTP